MSLKNTSTLAIPFTLALLIGAAETTASGFVADPPAGALRTARVNAGADYAHSGSRMAYDPSFGAPGADIVRIASPASVHGSAATVTAATPKITDAVTVTRVLTKDLRHDTARAELEPLPQRTFSWRDGDRTIAVVLEEQGPLAGRQPDKGFANASLEDHAETQPVFRSHSGIPMTLPGGILLELDPSWSAAAVEDFFGRNGIAFDRAVPLEYLPNGFFVATEPGIESLELANVLAGRNGVEASSPNWQRRVQPK